MRYVIVDLEATCWEKSGRRDQMEIIEIGSVLLASARGPAIDEFDRFVRPVAEPVLSEFCMRLTSISQADVDGADTFPAVLSEFLHWIGPEPFMLCSWGAYDLGQFRLDCDRHGVPLPESFERHVNLKEEFARVFGVRSRGMAKALVHVGLPLVGTHHRGIDDARNIGRLAELILPQLEGAGLIDDAIAATDV
jgi:inhibitor of KinA sporulation pathway (predicted exonuclease)